MRTLSRCACQGGHTLRLLAGEAAAFQGVAFLWSDGLPPSSGSVSRADQHLGQVGIRLRHGAQGLHQLAYLRGLEARGRRGGLGFQDLGCLIQLGGDLLGLRQQGRRQQRNQRTWPTRKAWENERLQPDWG